MLKRCPHRGPRVRGLCCGLCVECSSVVLYVLVKAPLVVVRSVGLGLSTCHSTNYLVRGKAANRVRVNPYLLIPVREVLRPAFLKVV